MIREIVSGGAAGVVLGYVLQRGQLCFHSAISTALERRTGLARAWALGVAIASVGLAVLLLLPGASGLNHGLAFRPVGNVGGGLLIGVGMVIARSCVSGLFYKLGSGMLGAVAGLIGWACGELTARKLHVPGPTVLPGGDRATLPGLVGLPRLPVAVLVLVVVVVVLWRWPGGDRPAQPWQWGWRRLGLALGVATTIAWALAAAGGVSFGPSTVGAVAGFAAGSPKWWLTSFLVGLVPGALVAARTAGGFWVRGERPGRYVRLVCGGFLLGAGGWIAGGCNLGHGLSGMAQLNVSSAVVVAAMVTGVALATYLPRAVRGRTQGLNRSASA